MDQLREIRERVNEDISEMSIKQIKEYFQKKSTLHTSKNWDFKKQ